MGSKQLPAKPSMSFLSSISRKFDRFIDDAAKPIANAVGDLVTNAYFLPHDIFNYVSGCDVNWGERNSWFSGFFKYRKHHWDSPLFRIGDTLSHLFWGGINTVTAGGMHIVFNQKLGLQIEQFAPPPKDLREKTRYFLGGLLFLSPLRTAAARAITKIQKPKVSPPPKNIPSEVLAWQNWKIKWGDTFSNESSLAITTAEKATHRGGGLQVVGKEKVVHQFPAVRKNSATIETPPGRYPSPIQEPAPAVPVRDPDVTNILNLGFNPGNHDASEKISIEDQNELARIIPRVIQKIEKISIPLKDDPDLIGQLRKISTLLPSKEREKLAHFLKKPDTARYDYIELLNFVRKKLGPKNIKKSPQKNPAQQPQNPKPTPPNQSPLADLDSIIAHLQTRIYSPEDRPQVLEKLRELLTQIENPEARERLEKLLNHSDTTFRQDYVRFLKELIRIDRPLTTKEQLEEALFELEMTRLRGPLNPFQREQLMKIFELLDETKLGYNILNLQRIRRTVIKSVIRFIRRFQSVDPELAKTAWEILEKHAVHHQERSIVKTVLINAKEILIGNPHHQLSQRILSLIRERLKSEDRNHFEIALKEFYWISRFTPQLILDEDIDLLERIARTSPQVHNRNLAHAIILNVRKTSP